MLHVVASSMFARIFQDISDFKPSSVAEAGPPAAGALVVIIGASRCALTDTGRGG